VSSAVLDVAKRKKPEPPPVPQDDDTTSFTTIQVRRDLAEMIDYVVRSIPGTVKNQFIDGVLRPIIKQRMAEAKKRIDERFDDLMGKRH
jgi:hypothetical protein